jgi:hypothetical protein
MLTDLPPTWAACFQVLSCVTADLRGTVLAGIDPVAKPLQPPGELRLIDGGGELLTSEKLLRLKRAGLSVGGLGYVKENDVRVELGRGVAVDRTGAVVLEPRGSRQL